MMHTKRLSRGSYKGMRYLRREFERRKEQRDRDVTTNHGGGAHRSCGRKQAYPSRAIAEIYAASNESRCGKDLYVYKCPMCHMWHITSHPGRRNEAK